MQNFSRGVSAAIDSHGFAFQYAALRVAKAAFEADTSPWQFECSELPVEVAGKNTAIDFVLRDRGGTIFLLCECKRANPAFSRWVFLRAPFLARGEIGRYLHAEVVYPSPGYPKLVARGLVGSSISDRAYDLGLVLRCRDRRTDEWTPGDRQDLVDAVTQLNVDVNGFVNHLSSRFLSSTADQGPVKCAVIPVLFTTADLFVSDVDLSTTDVLSGTIDPDSIQLRQIDWLYHQCHFSAALRHSHIEPDGSKPVRFDLLRDFVRSVPVVSANAISPFLSQFTPDVIRPLNPLQPRLG